MIKYIINDNAGRFFQKVGSYPAEELIFTEDRSQAMTFHKVGLAVDMMQTIDPDGVLPLGIQRQ